MTRIEGIRTRKMTSQMEQYKKQLEKQLPIVCGNAIRAYFDTYIFMYPAAYREVYSNTHLFHYSLFAIRDRTILSVKKLIEPAGKNKVNLESIVKIVTKPDCDYLNEAEKSDALQWLQAIQKSESAMRLKKFRDVIAHDFQDGGNAMIIYNDLMNPMRDVLNLLANIHEKVFNNDKMGESYAELKELALMFARDYWTGIAKGAKSIPKRQKELNTLNKVLQGNF